MKKQIRRGTFETNSSSTHAICITNDTGYLLPEHIDFHFGEFGWEFEEYTDVDTKASYLITAIFSFGKPETDTYLQQLKDILDDYHITYSIPNPRIKVWEYIDKKEYYYDMNGYIDHSGETAEFVEAVLADSDKLFRYLFGNSMVITGNDNGDAYQDRMYINEGEEDTIWGTYPRYGGLKPEFDNYEIYEKGN